MTVRVRFAPSPTGRLHVGNVRVALINWLLARREGGSFLLRLDDTDEERSTAAFAAGIETDLRWLGLVWDRSARQSERLEHYAAAADRLRADGRLYPCFETAEELALKRKSQLSRGLPPIYDRAALALDEAERARLHDAGRQPHWRFKLDHRSIAWSDRVRGDVGFEGENFSDPVLVRADGRPLYTLSSVVDDIDFAITDVVRGEDHVANTAVQVQLFETLGGAVPRFGHLPLLAGAEGEGLSKRLGSLSIGSLRDDGIEAMAINALLARLGTSDPVEPVPDVETLAVDFDLDRFGRATPKFDPAELRHLNARLLHAMPFEDARPRLEAIGLDRADRAFWHAVRGNLETIRDAATWWAICHDEVEPVIVDAALLERAAALLPAEPWDATTWAAWTGAVKAATGLKGKALFRPLRLALTAREHGPELKNLLPVIGRARTAARLAGKTA